MREDKEPVLPLGSFLFPRIFQAFRMAIQPTKLALAFLALATVCLTGRVMDISKPVVVAPNGMTELDEYVSGSPQVDEHIRLFGETGERTGVFITLWHFGAKRFHSAVLGIPRRDSLGIFGDIVACFAALLWAFTYHPVYSVILFAVTLAVMALAGGSICRIAALQFAQGEKPGLVEAVRFGRRKFYSFLAAPVAPVALMALIGLVIVLLGVIGNIEYVGPLCIGLFLPLALLPAAFIAIIAIGALAGFNLLFPTIAYEDSDCFDAMSRSFSYVYARPWRMGFYTVTAAVYGAICYEFVRFFSFLLLWITHFFLRIGVWNGNKNLTAIWAQPDFTDLLGRTAAQPQGWWESAAAFLIYMWVLIVVGLMVSYVISFYFSANTIIYALMRNRVDKTALEEIYPSSDDMAAEPLSFAKSRPSPAQEEEDSRQTPETSE
ncbi:MAG: hypothetical protein GXY19_17250 [Phycisphaerae bacterium]|nr:hypothetical protein [Phycisphaerae bacterium]